MITGHGYEGGWVQLDFLKAELLTVGGGPAGAIVTNPPYGHADVFVRHAITFMQPVKGTVAMLLRNEWDCASRRRDLFERLPFACKIILTKRLRWVEPKPGDNGPRHNYVWFIWSWTWGGLPSLRWGP